MLSGHRDEVCRRAHIGGQNAGIVIGDAAGHLDRSVSGNCRPQSGRELVHMLVGEEDAELELAGLGEEALERLVEVLRGLVDDEVGRGALRLRDGDALERGVERERDHVAAEEGRGVGLEQGL